jgi:amino acid transporter
MIAILFTAISYGRMASLYPAAGSAYTYLSRGLNVYLGFLTGWAMLLDYVVMPLFCIIFASLSVQRMLPQVPYAIWAFAFASILTGLNISGIQFTARVNMTVYEQT